MDVIYYVNEIVNTQTGARKKCSVTNVREMAYSYVSNAIANRTEKDKFDEQGNYTFSDGRVEPWFVIEELVY